MVFGFETFSCAFGVIGIVCDLSAVLTNEATVAAMDYGLWLCLRLHFSKLNQMNL